jgi:hypothetical protein
MPWRHVGEWRYSSTFLDLGTRCRWVVSLHPRRFSPGEIAPGTHCVGGCVGSEPVWICEGKILAPSGNLTWVFKHAASRDTDWELSWLCIQISEVSETGLNRVYILTVIVLGLGNTGQSCPFGYHFPVLLLCWMFFSRPFILILSASSYTFSTLRTATLRFVVQFS